MSESLLPSYGCSYSKEKLRPEPLTFGDLPYTVDAAVRANWDDPLGNYADYTPDSRETPAQRASRLRISMYTMFIDDIRRHEIWTINHGDSILRFSPAPVTVPRGRKALNGLINSIVRRFLKLFTLYQSKEQKKRRTEVHEKLTAAIASALGDRAAELISLDGLCTAPEKQGLGYASVLLDELFTMADAQSRGTWLITTHRTQTFYERFGFKTIASFSVGETNPTWKGDPVIVCLMLREPETMTLFHGEKAVA
ncbi:uncharacterized protein B0H18DRAFT_199934 [Fomitopsis serialis]|uniref:uncharacterized protein n=1 Tax=Fomitopsis serialis TaxID=139415 RepID=UPI0020081392|nr:uncharacterized protein B0H18DRAFT_199934 [Neoantrodia serialis]KAH9937501.1 hypothetical protein B0H18DRAFT_199934 [Neoantrodia serialis]